MVERMDSQATAYLPEDAASMSMFSQRRGKFLGISSSSRLAGAVILMHARVGLQS